MPISIFPAPSTGGSGAAFTGGTLTSALNEAAPVTIADSATPAIGAAGSNNLVLAGTTTITGFDTIPAGAKRTVRFAGIRTITYNATSMILPGAANLVTAVDDVAEFVSLGSGQWFCIDYQPKSGTASKLPPTGVAAGTYPAADITVGVDGRVTAAAAGSGPSAAGFDPLRAGGPSWVLSAGGQTVLNSTTTANAIFSLAGFTDKRYIEIYTQTGQSSGGQHQIGVSADRSCQRMGSGAGSADFGYDSSGNINYGAGAGTSISGWDWPNECVLMLAMDVVAQKVWIGKDGSWYGGGDPAAGTSPTYTFTTGKTKYWWGASNDSSNTNGTFGLRWKFKAADCIFKIPEGFAAMDGGRSNPAEGPQPVGFGAHRYWRLSFPSRGGAYTSVSELEFRDRATYNMGLEQRNTGGTPSASSEGQPATGAFNGSFSDSDRWYANQASSAWLQYDFGAGNLKKIVEIAIMTSVGAGQNPTIIDVQYSDDGSTFTTVRHITSAAINRSNFMIYRLEIVS